MGDESAEELLVGLLQEAAQLEHCLLDSYLYAACSLRSFPEEFATLPGGRENRRRAIQYERVRAWKQAILEVAREEMLHLHYVQCMLRALGADPYFGLPERDATSGNWLFGNWQIRVDPHESTVATEVPVAPFTPENARRFVMYESTDAMQDRGLFDPAAMDLFERLHSFEVDLLLETVLLDVADDSEREALKAKLRSLYDELTPAEPPPAAPAAFAAAVGDGIQVSDVRFQSIADLYYKGILPLYQEAFERGRVPHANVDLNSELLNPDYAQEGLLPIGPISRDKNFEKRARADAKDALRNYKDVAEVIAEIVEEGEGLTGFPEGAEALLAKVHDLGGARAYLQVLLADAQSPKPTPDWLARAQNIRDSHLYRFAMAMVEVDQERDLASEAGVGFEPARTPLPAGQSTQVDNLAEELPAQFNATYLCLLAWLARIYEIHTWESDERRRMGIEMLASWPMMSIAIRPFLELAAFVSVPPAKLFRVEADALPPAPVHARQLFELYSRADRSQEVLDRMDGYAMKALTDVAEWAREQSATLAGADLDPVTGRLIQARLSSLAHLDEFERQFPYREHGGYSGRSPDIEFLTLHPDGQKYEEAPRAPDPSGNPLPAFADTLVLRLRFAGRELVQLATDPDPPTDESGCTGTHMLHASDSPGWFDRAHLWQPDQEQNTIVREPRDELPPLGVRGAEVALLATTGAGAFWGYVPIGTMSSAGAVQASGVMQAPQMSGLSELLAVAPAEVLGEGGGITVDLLGKDGVMPFHNGYNHLVWADGEPIDPFVLSVGVGAAGGAPQELLRREVFNQGLWLMEMDPLQRMYSARGPSGFDSYTNIPAWAVGMLSPEEQAALADPGFPISYLDARAGVLGAALQRSLLAPEWTQATVDTAISFAERTRLVANPRGTTVGWLPALLHYGHSVSGDQTSAPAADPVPAALGERLGVELSVAAGGRDWPNGRWIAEYSQGVMDTDALSAVVYGQLYVPLSVKPGAGPVRFEPEWSFPAGMDAVLAGYACKFDAPFWATFEVHGNERSITLPDGKTTIVETLVSETGSGYTYTATGVPGISDYSGSFEVTSDGQSTVLAWATSWTAADSPSLVHMLSINAGGAAAMGASLDAHFSPAAG